MKGIQTPPIMIKEMNPGTPMKKQERIQGPQIKMEKKNSGPTNKNAGRIQGPLIKMQDRNPRNSINIQIFRNYSR
jgi:hypothetical protein